MALPINVTKIRWLCLTNSIATYCKKKSPSPIFLSAMIVKDNRSCQSLSYLGEDERIKYSSIKLGRAMYFVMSTVLMLFLWIEAYALRSVFDQCGLAVGAAVCAAVIYGWIRIAKMIDDTERNKM